MKFYQKYRKKILASALALIIILTPLFTYSFLRPRTALADSLFTFNEGYGTSINDNNGNVTAGTITNAVWKTSEFCFDDKCLYFDGSGDFVSFTDNANLDFVAADDLTISGWFRHPVIATNPDYLITKHQSTVAGGYKIYMDSDGDIVFGIDDDGTWDTVDIVGDDQSKNFDDNKWHFFTAQKDGTTGIYLYIDGNLIDSDTSLAETGTIANAANFYIGIDADGTSNGWSGFIDEVKIYRSLRTASEIKTDFSKETPTRGTAASFGPNQSYLSNGLIGFWKMNDSGIDAEGEISTDSSGNNNSGTLYGDNGVGDNGTGMNCTNSGKFETGCDLDGTDDYIGVTDNDIFNPSQITTAAWVKFDTLPSTKGTDEFIINHRHTASPWNSFFIYGRATTDKFVCFTAESGGNMGYVYGNTTIVVNTWYHVTCAWDGQELKLFVNGILDKAPTSLVGSAVYNANQPVTIGSLTSSSSFLDGNVDDVRIYNRALSPTEAGQLYSWGPGPVGHWKLDENTGTAANDSSGLDNTGTLTNTPAWTTGKYGSAASFTGSNQHITRADDTDFDFGTAASFSYGAWIKHGTASALEMIIDKYDATAGNGGFKLYMESDGDFTCGIDDDETSFPEASATSTLANYDDNLWHHIDCIKDGTSTLKLYIDGVLIVSTDISGVTGDFANADPLYIAIAEDAVSNDWVGQIDDVRIYNYPRNSSQVIEDMNAGHPAPGSPVGSAVAHWKFDEGYGTTANDGSVNANSLTLSTASWTNSGKFGKAFNGLTNVRASRTTDSDLEFSATEDFTLSLWYKSDSATNPGAVEYLINDGAAAGSAGYAIYANTSGNLCFGIDDDASWGPDVASCTTTDVYDNTWHHITAVRNVALDTTRIYLDAVEKDSDPDTTTATLDSSPTFYIGDANGTDGTDEFLGDIDEVKIYRSALTSDQIKVLFNQNSGQQLGALSTDASNNPSNSSNDEYCPPGQGSACTAPVGHWKMDEGSWTNNCSTDSVFDSSSNGNNGDSCPASTGPTATIPGRFGSAGNFDGTDDYIEIADNAAFSSGFLTACAQVKLDQLASTLGHDAYIFFQNNSFYMRVDNPSNQVTSSVVNQAGTPEYAQTNTVLTINTWYHICLVWNGSNVYTYVNGKKDGTNNALSGTSLFDGTGVGIGGWSGASNDLDGSIDNVYLYNYARTPAQIAWDYNWGKPVGWYRFDEGSGTSANDASGFGNTGTLTNTPTWTTGKLNGALSFAGSNQHVTRADDPDFDFVASEPFTVTGWFKHNTASATESLITKLESSGTDGGYKIKMESDGDITCETDDDDADTTIDNTATTTLATYDDNSWHHVACVYDTANTDLIIYIDGKSTASNTSITTNSLANNDALFIGIESATGTQDWIGNLDDIRIYRYPLTVTQIKSVINEGALHFGQ